MTAPGPHAALMHAVLDGEATPAEAAELERVLAADPAARAEFDALRRLFGVLARVPRLDPPAGLADSTQVAFQLSRRSHVSHSKPFPARQRTMNKRVAIFGGIAAAAVAVIGIVVMKDVPSGEAAGTENSTTTWAPPRSPNSSPTS